MHSIVHAADIQDRDGGVMLMASIFGLFPFLLKLYADSVLRGDQGENRIASSRNAPEPRLGCLTRMLP